MSQIPEITFRCLGEGSRYNYKKLLSAAKTLRDI